MGSLSMQMNPLLICFFCVLTYVALVKVGLVVSPLSPSIRLSAKLLGYLVCELCNSKSFRSFLFKTLHNGCSHIEDVHFLFCAHLIICSHFLRGLDLDICSIRNA